MAAVRERPERGTTLGLLGILVLAGALRALAWSRTEALFDDGPIFLYIAEAMSVGDWSRALAHPFHPLYPFLAWLASGLAGSLESGAVAVSVAAGVASVGALYVFVRDAFDARTGLVAAALLAVHPNALAFSSDVQSDGLYAALFLAGVAALWRALATESRAPAVWAGLFCGLAYLTRPEGLGIVVVGTGFAASRLLAGRWTFGRTAGWLAALGVGIALVGSPYLLTLRGETGAWTLTQKKSVATLAGIEAEDAPVRAPRALPLPTAGARVQRPEGAAGVLAAANDVYRSAASGLRFETLALVALGLFAARRKPGDADRGRFVAAFVVLYAVVLFALAQTAGYVSRRHALPAMLPLLGYAALGVPALGAALLGLAERVRLGGFAPSRRSVVALALGMAIFLAFALPRDLRPRRPYEVAERAAAVWLRDAALTPGPLAAGRLRVAYYAERDFVQLPEQATGDVLKHLRRNDVRYVIVTESRLAKDPGVRKACEEGTRTLHSEVDAGRTALVLEVLPVPGDDP